MSLPSMASRDADVPRPSPTTDQTAGSYYTGEQLVKIFGGWTATRIRKKLRGPMAVAFSQEAEWPWYAIIGLILVEFLNTLNELGPVGALCFPQARVHEPTKSAAAADVDTQDIPPDVRAPHMSTDVSDPTHGTQISSAKPSGAKKKKPPQYQAPDFAHLACFPEDGSTTHPFMHLINWFEVKRRRLGTREPYEVDGVNLTQELADDMPQLEKQAKQAFLREGEMSSYIMVFMCGLDFTALEWSREGLDNLTAALEHMESALDTAPANEPQATPNSTSQPAGGLSASSGAPVIDEHQRRPVIPTDAKESVDVLSTLQFQGTYFWKQERRKKLLEAAKTELKAYRNIVSSKHQSHIPDEDYDPLMAEFDNLRPEDIVDMHPTMIYHAQRALIGDGDTLRASDSFVNTLRLAHRPLAGHAEYSYSEFFPLPQTLDAFKPSTVAMNIEFKCMKMIYKATIERLWERRFEKARREQSDVNTSAEWEVERRFGSDESLSGEDEDDWSDDGDQLPTQDTSSVLLQNQTTSSLPKKQVRGARAAPSGSSRIPIATGRHAHFAPNPIETSTPSAPRREGLRPRTDAGKAIIPTKEASSAALNRGVAGAEGLAASTQVLTSASVARASSSSSVVVSAMGRMTVSEETQSSKAGPSRLPKPTNAHGEATEGHDQVGPREHTETSSAAKKGKGKQKAVQESISVDSTRTRYKGKKRVAEDDEPSALEARMKRAKRNGEGDSD